MIVGQLNITAIAVLTGACVYIVALQLAKVFSGYLARQQISLRLETFAQVASIDEFIEIKPWQHPINNWLRTKSGSRFSKLVEQARLGVSPLSVAGNMVVIMAALLILGIFFTGSLISSLIMSGGAYFIATVWLKQKRIRYEQRFVDQLPHALTLMSNALSSSSSLVQSIEHVVRETQPPVKNELLKVLENIRLGMNLDQALDLLHKQLPVDELELVISTLVIQRRVGGNIAKLLSRASELLREKVELKNELMVQTAQSRLSGKVIGLLPLFVVTFLLIVDRGFIAPLFNTGLGLTIFFLACIAELIGFLLIRRVLDIEF